MQEPHDQFILGQNFLLVDLRGKKSDLGMGGGAKKKSSEIDQSKNET